MSDPSSVKLPVGPQKKKEVAPPPVPEQVQKVPEEPQKKEVAPPLIPQKVQEVPEEPQRKPVKGI